MIFRIVSVVGLIKPVKQTERISFLLRWQITLIRIPFSRESGSCTETQNPNCTHRDTEPGPDCCFCVHSSPPRELLL